MWQSWQPLFLRTRLNHDHETNVSFGKTSHSMHASRTAHVDHSFRRHHQKYTSAPYRCCSKVHVDKLSNLRCKCFRHPSCPPVSVRFIHPVRHANMGSHPRIASSLRRPSLRSRTRHCNWTHFLSIPRAASPFLPPELLWSSVLRLTPPITLKKR